MGEQGVRGSRAGPGRVGRSAGGCLDGDAVVAVEARRRRTSRSRRLRPHEYAAHWKRAAVRVRRWLMPTSLRRSGVVTSPAPTVAKHQPAQRPAGQRPLVDLAGGHAEVASAACHARPSHWAARPTSSSHSGSPAGTITSTHAVVSGPQHHPPARPAPHHVDAEGAGRPWSTSSGPCVEPRTSAGRSASSTHTARPEGSGTAPGVQSRRPGPAADGRPSRRARLTPRSAGTASRCRARTDGEGQPAGAAARAAGAAASRSPRAAGRACARCRDGRRPPRCPRCGCRPGCGAPRGRCSRPGRCSTGSGAVAGEHRPAVERRVPAVRHPTKRRSRTTEGTAMTRRAECMSASLACSIWPVSPRTSTTALRSLTTQEGLERGARARAPGSSPQRYSAGPHQVGSLRKCRPRGQPGQRAAPPQVGDDVPGSGARSPARRRRSGAETAGSPATAGGRNGARRHHPAPRLTAPVAGSREPTRDAGAHRAPPSSLRRPTPRASVPRAGRRATAGAAAQAWPRPRQPTAAAPTSGLVAQPAGTIRAPRAYSMRDWASSSAWAASKNGSPKPRATGPATTARRRSSRLTTDATARPTSVPGAAAHASARPPARRRCRQDRRARRLGLEAAFGPAGAQPAVRLHDDVPMWPALPAAPSSSRPSTTMPPPTPVDTTMAMKSRSPGPRPPSPRPGPGPWRRCRRGLEPGEVGQPGPQRESPATPGCSAARRSRRRAPSARRSPRPPPPRRPAGLGHQVGQRPTSPRPARPGVGACRSGRRPRRRRGPRPAWCRRCRSPAPSPRRTVPLVPPSGSARRNLAGLTHATEGDRGCGQHRDRGTPGSDLLRLLRAGSSTTSSASSRASAT